MRRLLSFLIIFFFIPLLIWSQEDVAQLIYRQGIAKYVKRDYVGASEDLERAYRLSPEDVRIRDMLRNAQIKLGGQETDAGDLEKAALRFRRALELGPDEAQKKQIEDVLLENQELQFAKKNPPLIATTVQPPQGTPEGSGQPPGNISTQNGTVTPTAPGVPVQSSPGTLSPQYNPTGPSQIIVRTQSDPRMDEALRKLIESQAASTEALVNSISESQQEDRSTLQQGFTVLAEGQKGDREEFRTLFMVLLFAILIFATLAVGIIFLISWISRKRTHQGSNFAHMPMGAAEQLTRSERLLELTKEMDGTPDSWSRVSGYIGELNSDIKSEILDLVEKKLDSPGQGSEPSTILEVLLPLITDNNSQISSRSRTLAGIAVGTAGGGPQGIEGPGDKAEGSGDLDLEYLKQLCRMVHSKTGRRGSPFQTAELALQLAAMLEDPELDPDVAYQVTLVHDVGYLELPNKVFIQAQLSTEDQELIKSHTIRGLEMLGLVEIPTAFRDAILYHHERMDGSGYPEGLAGEAIPKIARLVAVVDFFVAVTSVRPHRQPLTIPQCLMMMEKVSGSLLDGKMVEVLVELFKGVEN